MLFFKYILILCLLLFFFTTNAQVSDFNSIDFSKADNRAKLYAGKSLENLPLLAHVLTTNLDTDVEKFRAIYVWVCNNIKGDIRQNEIVSRKQKKHNNDSLGYIQWNNAYKMKAFKILLKEKKTMCTGYAYLIKELCFLVNIECEIIDGYGRTTESNVDALEAINHSWNAVKLNNKWYVCDATWSSGYVINNSFFVKDYNDGYFLSDPVLFATNHYPIYKKWLLNSTLEASEFVATPLVYGDLFKHQIIPIIPSEMKIITSKNEDVYFSFKALKPIPDDKIHLITYHGTTEHFLKIRELKNEDGIISFKCTFETKGFFDIHLKLENDIVATYTAQVTKL